MRLSARVSASPKCLGFSLSASTTLHEVSSSAFIVLSPLPWLSLDSGEGWLLLLLRLLVRRASCWPSSRFRLPAPDSSIVLEEEHSVAPPDLPLRQVHSSCQEFEVAREKLRAICDARIPRMNSGLNPLQELAGIFSLLVPIGSDEGSKPAVSCVSQVVPSEEDIFRT